MNHTIENITEDPFPTNSTNSASTSSSSGGVSGSSGGSSMVSSDSTTASSSTMLHVPTSVSSSSSMSNSSTLAATTTTTTTATTATNSIETLSMAYADSGGPSSVESALSIRTTSPLLHPSAMPLSSLPGLTSLSGHSLHLASKYFSALPSAGSAGVKRALTTDYDSENDDQNAAACLKRRKMTLISSPSFSFSIKPPMARKTESDDENGNAAAEESETVKRLKLKLDVEETSKLIMTQSLISTMATTHDSLSSSSSSSLSTTVPSSSSSSTSLSSNGLLLIEPEEELFCVHIHPILGADFDVYLSPLDTLGDFKFAIFEEMNIYPDHQILYFKEDNLNTKPESTLLTDLGIQNGSQMKLFISIKGGPGAPFLNASLPDSHSFFDRVFPLVDSETSNTFLYKTDDDELVMVELSSSEKSESDLEKELNDLIKEKEQEQEQEENDAANQSKISSSLLQNPSSLDVDVESLSSLGSIHISSPPRSLLTASAELEVERKSTQDASPSSCSRTPLKCQSCCKKLRLTNGFQCKCGNYFCSEHRYSNRHACSYDFLAQSRIDLKRHNPLIVKDKI